MAILDMKKMLLIGSKNEKEKLYTILQRLSCVEVISLCDVEKEEKETETESNLKAKVARLNEILSIVKELDVEVVKVCKERKIKYFSHKRPILTPIPSIDFDDFIGLSLKESDFLLKLEEFDKIYNEILDLRAEIVKSKNKIMQLQPYEELDLKASEIKDTKRLSLSLGLFESSKVSIIEKIKENFPLAYFHAKTADGSKQLPLFYICFKEQKEEIKAQLYDAEYQPANFDFDNKPKDEINDLKDRIVKAEASIKDKLIEIMEFNNLIEEIKLFLDYYTFEEEKAKIDNGLSTTKKTYLLEAWVPDIERKKVEKTLDKSKLSLYYEFQDPGENDIPPTLMKNNSFVAPYEAVTNMYSAPKYKEVDPNKFVSFFFFVLAGMMLSDAGYGFVLTLISIFLLWRLKPRKGEMKIVKILFMMGISTMIWGVLFGGYFGYTYKPLLFAPLDNPIGMLALGLVLGLVQLLFGMGINAYVFLKDKKILDAIFKVFAWYVLLIGLILFFLGGRNMKGIVFAATLKIAGKWTMLAGLIGVFIGGMLHVKGIKKISKGASALYDLVNLFSDVLSYSRLFGLGLATSVIAFVFNEIALVIMNLIPVAGHIVAVIILIAGHTLNIGINVLGAYVHNARLQFIEFFGKFYEGGGRLFRPLGFGARYYRIENKENTTQGGTKS